MQLHRYFCTYVCLIWPCLGNAYARLQCKIYIADDKPSRSQHENGLKHKGNVDRYVREVYKKGETNKKDKADEAAELARVNNVRLPLFALLAWNSDGASSNRQQH